MVTTSKQIETWIQEEHEHAGRLLSLAIGGGSYAQRAEQANRAAALFKRCEAFAEIRTRLLGEEQEAARLASAAEAERTAAGRRNMANAGFDSAAAAAVICQQQAVAAAGGLA